MRKFLAVIFSLFFVSCAGGGDEAQIRIVDLQGHAKPVATKIPELNKQALAAQGAIPADDQIVYNSSSQLNQNKNSNQDFGAMSSRAIQETLQSQQYKNPKIVEEKQTQIAPRTKDQEVEYDLSEDVKEPIELPKVVATKEKKSAKKSTSKKGYFVQVGSFINHASAKQTLDSMKKFEKESGGAMVETVEGEKTIYRALLGPFENKKQAMAMMKKIKNSGRDAIIVKK